MFCFFNFRVDMTDNEKGEYEFITVHRGDLSAVGSSTKKHDSNIRKYTVIEIGETVLRNVKVEEKLNAFLSVQDRGETALHFDGKSLIAIERPNGKIYFLGFRESGLFGQLLLCILTIPILGIGLIGLIMLPHMRKKDRIGVRWSEKLLALGGTDLNRS